MKGDGHSRSFSHGRILNLQKLFMPFINTECPFPNFCPGNQIYHIITYDVPFDELKLPEAWDPIILHSDHDHWKRCTHIKRWSGASTLPKNIILLLRSNMNQP